MALAQRGVASTASSACVVVQCLTQCITYIHTCVLGIWPMHWTVSFPLSVFLNCSVSSSMIIAPLVVLLVEDPANAALPRNYKFRCSSEVVARKVTQLINFAKTVHEYEKTVVQSYRHQMKNIW